MAKSLTLPKLKKKLQPKFNKFIRQRDTDGDYFECISCGQTKHVSKMDAGHFFPVKGYDSLRFDEDNVHGECKYCNCFDHSHLIGYSINLKERIGEERFNALRERAAEYKRSGYKWTRYELEEMIEKYEKLLD